VSADVIVFKQRDGSVDFTCLECGERTYAPLGILYREPVCKCCEWWAKLKRAKAEAQAL
jgi:hypothetical protein